MKPEDRELLTAIDIADLAMQKVVDIVRKRGDARWGRLAAIQGEFCAPVQRELVEPGEPVSMQPPTGTSEAVCAVHEMSALPKKVDLRPKLLNAENDDLKTALWNLLVDKKMIRVPGMTAVIEFSMAKPASAILAKYDAEYARAPLIHHADGTMSVPGRDTCPDCLRRKAHNVDDARNGLCPKWWAIRDQAADDDCARAAKERKP